MQAIRRRFQSKNNGASVFMGRRNKSGGDDDLWSGPLNRTAVASRRRSTPLAGPLAGPD